MSAESVSSEARTLAAEGPGGVLPPKVDRFRAEFREKNIGPRYRGLAHFALTASVSLGVIAWALSRLGQVQPLEWLTVPLTFVVANAAEYFGHRGPMHHRTRGLGLVFQRHTLEHHRFFTHETMAAGSTRDYKAVLFPPVMLLFFLGGIATPLGLLVFLLATPNAGWLFVATAVGYFLSYECLHLAYHLPESHPLSRLPLLARLRRHHLVHHNPQLMSRYHFNISFPLFDRLLGTQWRPEVAPGQRPLPQQ